MSFVLESIDGIIIFDTPLDDTQVSALETLQAAQHVQLLRFSRNWLEVLSEKLSYEESINVMLKAAEIVRSGNGAIYLKLRDQSTKESLYEIISILDGNIERRRIKIVRTIPKKLESDEQICAETNLVKCQGNLYLSRTYFNTLKLSTVLERSPFSLDMQNRVIKFNYAGRLRSAFLVPTLMEIAALGVVTEGEIEVECNSSQGIPYLFYVSIINMQVMFYATNQVEVN